MMAKVVYGLLLASMMIGSVFASETPEKLFDNYLSDFNAQDTMKIERNFSFPLVFIQNGKKSILNDVSAFLNFDKIKETGWNRSAINSLTLLFEKTHSAIAQMNFSRINNAGNVYLQTDGNYILTKENGQWYISGIMIDTDIPLGTDYD
jgi:hypothetical protein